ncbi:hypothetical protein WA026_018610 [Henosepilachna vigintioctopunctata]|uniref:Uncharacterized protein n=1 Tax=Henosepilachna vigintioctopunctata TaxID=420089 RepID=A0AAW1UE12_9CUCU
MDLDAFDSSFDYGLEDENFYEPIKTHKRRVTFNPETFVKNDEAATMAIISSMKQEMSDGLDDSDDGSGPSTMDSIQKVPSLSDLSDPEASLGKCNIEFGGCARDLVERYITIFL